MFKEVKKPQMGGRKTPGMLQAEKETALKKKAAKADKKNELMDFILGRGDYPFRYEVDYEDVYHNYDPKSVTPYWVCIQKGLISDEKIQLALRERFDRVSAVGDYFWSLYENNVSDRLVRRKSLIKNLREEHSQLARDAAVDLRTIKGETVETHEDLFLWALREDNLIDFLLGRGKFTDYQSRWAGGSYDTGKQTYVENYFLSLPVDSPERGNLRDFLVEYLHKTGDEKKVVMYIVTALLEQDPKLKEEVDNLPRKDRDWIYEHLENRKLVQKKLDEAHKKKRV
ncbi:MAG: hypothetical protein JW778_04695 [Candidatus Altiarchaeota archaeon]|nr:hypothetical protein [Candidatus Altiarchaeota archaeon]